MEKLSDLKKIENSVIENWTKKTSVGWLRKQRDGVIGHLEERIKKLKNTTENKIEELSDIAKELTELNDEIYEIEHSTITHEADSESDSESNSESDSKSKSKLESESNVKNKTFRYFGPPHPKLKPDDMLN